MSSTSRSAAATSISGHARALLESLLVASGGHRTNSTASTAPSSSSSSSVISPTLFSSASNGGNGNPQLHLTPTFKPHKPSSLSSSASASASEDGAERDRRRGTTGENDGTATEDDADEDDDGSEMATSPPFSASFKAAQLSMQALNHHRPPPSSALSKPSLGPNEYLAEILALLNDSGLDEEHRIDKVRSTLSTALFSLEGVVSTPSRLDSLVLDLLHRHREDLNPTGASFAPLPNASPARRPASIRSYSSSRPWTPSKPPFASNHSTPGPGPNGDALQGATSPLLSTIGIPQNGSSLMPSGLSSTGSPKPHPGVIGSGSPRASPRPWNRTLSNFSTTSINSSLGGETSVVSPISSVPPGLGGPNSASRPASPSPFGSPRLNVAAIEFRPKNSGGGAGSVAALTPTRPTPWLVRRPSSNASSTNLALANKSHAGAGDDDDDEFSPFGTNKPAAAWPPPLQHPHPGSIDVESYWYNSGASATSSNGGWDPNPFSSIATSTTGAIGEVAPTMPGADGGDDAAGFGSAGMTPFDLLYSILVTETKQGMAEWSPEQVDEALMANGYDFERTLNAIWENGGKPLGDGSRSILSGVPGGNSASGPVKPYVAGSPRVENATVAASTPNIRAGVNVLNREAFSSMHRNGSGFGAAAKFGGNGRGYASASSAATPRSPGVTPAGLAGALHGAKVCRYFLAGECRRSDCKFSHDLSRAVCRYWLKGQCAHNPCNFLHDYEALNMLAAGITGVQLDNANAAAAAAAEAAAKPANDDFPELGLANGPAGPKTVATRGRWSAALQRNNTTPLALAQKEGQAVINLHSKGGIARSVGSGGAAAAASQQRNGGASGSTRGSARIALRAPLLLPTIATGKQAAQSYAAHRGDSLALAEQRNKLLARASDAFRRGDFASAKKWSREASQMNEKFQEESRGAAREILRERMKALRTRLTDPIEAGASVTANQSDEPGARGMKGKLVGNGLGVCLGVVKTSALQASMPSSMASNLSADERTECFLDLHGLHSQEAVEVVEEFVLGLERENIQGLAYLGIGRERHSSKETDKRRVKVAGFVKQFLSSYGYPFAECEGVLVVDPCTHI
ncbi:hypothetical protein ACQY0O_005071 [Thecaphora frezii]